MSLLLRKFIRHRRGNVAPIFAIAAIPLIVAMGGVVDYTNAYDQETMVQDAMDSAALAAGKKIGLLTMSELEQDVDNYYTSNLADKMADPPPLATAVTGSTITLTTELHVPTYFLSVIGLDELVFPLESQATLALGTLEVAMVLDNSGSMNHDNNIATLRQAATDLTNTLYNLGVTSTKPDPIKVGLVPFAAAVNVGPQFKNDAGATWIDKTGIGTYHADSMDDDATDVNAFDLFDAMNNAQWGGCVEMRPKPFDASDDGASPADPDTMFVPMFSPDAPDNWTCSGSSCQTAGSYSNQRYNGAPSGSKSYNNYLPDFDGSCVGNDSNWTCRNGSCGGGANEDVAYERTCKYDGESPRNVTVGGIPGGPNFMCTTTKITDLTTDKPAVLSGISSMIAEGATNLQAGLMWGWRVLSPTSPFTAGRDYTVNDNQKILILMTDGFNTYYPNGQMLRSWYGAWGYVSKGHLGTTSTNQNYLIGKMNERTTIACQNVKAAGITVYTVSFQVDDQDTLAMMEGCATDPSKAYVSTSQSALLAAFSAIGEDITLLRISH